MKSKQGWALHPATVYFLLLIAIILLSWIMEIYGQVVILPQTGEELKVQSLISPEGIRWLLRHIITNFTGFQPLGMVIIAMLGIGVMQQSGLLDACFRSLRDYSLNKKVAVGFVIILGILSNVIGDAGYIILLPLSAHLFYYNKLHPVAGVITAFASVACGYSANIMLSTMDPMLARISGEASEVVGVSQHQIGPLSNYIFMSVSTVIIAIVVYFITIKKLIPQTNQDFNSVEIATRALSRKERRALYISLAIGLLYLLIVLFSTFSSYGILRGVSGNLMRSPFIMGILFIISLGLGVMGMSYGLFLGKYRSDRDIVEGFTNPMQLIGIYIAITFFASQMFACIEYTHLDKYFAIWSAGLFFDANLSPLPALVLFIVYSAFINLIMVSATAKWGLMAFIFIPMFSALGISPDMIQCAFRIGDSSTNAITPFLFYMPLVLAYLLQYNKRASYLTLVKYTWRYSIFTLLSWIALFILWYITRLPLGV